jgi:hypothetical protein
VNAREAESRRVARFWNEGHSAGVIETAAVGLGRAGSLPVTRFEDNSGGAEILVVPPETISYEFPKTLDLRRPSYLQVDEMD